MEKIAVVTDKEWLRHSVSIFGYLIPGEIRAFPATQEGDARVWVASGLLARRRATRPEAADG